MIVFDDGPDDTTAPILDALAEHGVRAVFFVNGKNIAGHEQLLQRMVAEGHEIGNHGWSHRVMDEMTFAEAVFEIDRTSDAIYAATGVRPTRLRPPFRRWPENFPAPIAGHKEILTESSLGDYAMTAVEIIAAAAKVQGTLFLHDGVPATVEALPAILKARA